MKNIVFFLTFYFIFGKSNVLSTGLLHPQILSSKQSTVSSNILNENDTHKVKLLPRTLMSPKVQSLKRSSLHPHRNLLEKSFNQIPIAQMEPEVKFSQDNIRRKFIANENYCDDETGCVIKGVQVSLKHSFGISWCKDCLESFKVIISTSGKALDWIIHGILGTSTWIVLFSFRWNSCNRCTQ